MLLSMQDYMNDVGQGKVLRGLHRCKHGEDLVERAWHVRRW